MLEALARALALSRAQVLPAAGIFEGVDASNAVMKLALEIGAAVLAAAFLLTILLLVIVARALSEYREERRERKRTLRQVRLNQYPSLDLRTADRRTPRSR